MNIYCIMLTDKIKIVIYRKKDWRYKEKSLFIEY